MSFPLRKTLPSVTGRAPQMTSHSSSCPLPLTPATPNISPSMIWKVRWSSTGMAPLCFTVTFLSSRHTFFPWSSCSSSRFAATISLPIISLASSTSLVSLAVRFPVSLPFLITIIRSATSMTSFILWVMKITELPFAVYSFTNCIRVSDSWGVRTAVGSSMIRRLVFR